LRPTVLTAEERIHAREPASFLMRDGASRLVLPLENGRSHVLASVGRGEFSGEIGFTDRNPRSADAIAAQDTRLFSLSRGGLATAAAAYLALETELHARLSQALAARACGSRTSSSAR